MELISMYMFMAIISFIAAFIELWKNEQKAVNSKVPKSMAAVLRGSISFWIGVGCTIIALAYML